MTKSRGDGKTCGTDPLAELLRLAPAGATFDSTRRHRYSLTRELADDSMRRQPLTPILFCGFNPSTADETTDDPTLRREIAFANDLGGGYLIKVNLLACRATDPNEINFAEAKRTFGENIGRVADLADLTLQVDGKIIAAWGIPKGPKRIQELAAEVAKALTDESRIGNSWQSFCLTKEGHPRHPLYLRKTAWQNLSNLTVLRAMKNHWQ